MVNKISLVTGGAGFIGSHVVDHLLKMNHKVVVIDDLSGGFISNIDSHASFEKGSVVNNLFLEEIFHKYSFDYVFHLAAYAAEGLSHFIRKYNYENNIVGSINLINLAIKNKVKHFVFTSSIAVYGTNQTPMSEDLIPNPEDPYGIAKYAVELDLKSANRLFGLNYTIFRPHNVYGPRQNHGDPYRNVLGIFINNIMLKKPLTIFGDGRQKRAFSYIDDVAPYIAQSICNSKAKNQVINIGSDKPYPVIDLARIIAKLMCVKPNIRFLPPRNEVINAFSNHDKAKKIFGIKKTTDLEIGIKKMIDWSVKIGPLKTKRFKNIEINANIPPSWNELI